MFKVALYLFIGATLYLLFVFHCEAGTEKSKLDKLNPAFRVKVCKLLEQARSKFDKHTIIVATTYRPQWKQDLLFKKGSNTTTVRVSKHTKGLAADIYFIEDGKILEYSQAPYLELGVMAEELGMIWGGRWKVPFDPGHFEQGGKR